MGVNVWLMLSAIVGHELLGWSVQLHWQSREGGGGVATEERKKNKQCQLVHPTRGDGMVESVRGQVLPAEVQRVGQGEGSRNIGVSKGGVKSRCQLTCDEGHKGG